MIDAQARAEYKRRIAELEQEVEAAEARNDGEMAAKARQEMDALVGALVYAYGLRGAPRRTPDHIERGRKAVTRRIRDALHRIERAYPALGRHLNASLGPAFFAAMFQSEMSSGPFSLSQVADLSLTEAPGENCSALNVMESEPRWGVSRGPRSRLSETKSATQRFVVAGAFNSYQFWIVSDGAVNAGPRCRFRGLA